MKTKLRIPAVTGNSRFAMERWFHKLYVNNVLFHPDDSPENIVDIVTGAPTFTAEECVVLNKGKDLLFGQHGDEVYEVGMKYFRKAMGFKPEHA